MIFLVNPLHYALHHDRTWRFAAKFPFVASRPFLTIARSEVRSLAQVAPLAICRVKDHVQAVVLINSAWTRSPLFGPDMAWLHGTPPLAVRYHPFRTIEDGSGTGRSILAVCADPECVLADQSEEGFYDILARPLPKVRAVFRRLQQIDRETRQMNVAAKALVSLGVTMPLPIADAAGRSVFETINMAAFEKLEPGILADSCDRPQDVALLAHALDHSGRLNLAPFETDEETLVPSSSQPATGNASSATEPSFLIEDDLVMTFG